jgi:hypothetical protein
METPQIPAWLSPAERMTRARALGLAPVVQRRPERVLNTGGLP